MIATLSVDDVIDIHDAILETEIGVKGYHGNARLGGALGRIDNQILYGNLTDIFDIAAWYVEAIAMGHCFADANKRTALTCALTFLDINNTAIEVDETLSHLVEDLVKREVTREDFANVLAAMSID